MRYIKYTVICNGGEKTKTVRYVVVKTTSSAGTGARAFYDHRPNPESGEVRVPRARARAPAPAVACRCDEHLPARPAFVCARAGGAGGAAAARMRMRETPTSHRPGGACCCCCRASIDASFDEPDELCVKSPAVAGWTDARSPTVQAPASRWR